MKAINAAVTQIFIIMAALKAVRVYVCVTVLFHLAVMFCLEPDRTFTLVG